MHVHPLSDIPLHVDFYKVDLQKKTTAKVPLEFIGESEAVKQGGILLEFLNEIEIEALPEDIPSSIQVDISALENIGDFILVKNLPIHHEVELKIDSEELVCKIEEPKEEEEVEETPMPEDVEVEKEKKDEETEGEGKSGREEKKD